MHVYTFFKKSGVLCKETVKKKFKTRVLSIVCYTGVVISRLFNLSYTLLRSGHQALLLAMTKRVDSTSKRLNHIFNKSIENID